MISLTEEARKELEAYFEGKEKTPIRVYLAPAGLQPDPAWPSPSTNPARTTKRPRTTA